VTLIDTKGEVKAYPLKEKRDVAKDIINKLATLLK